MSSRKRRHDGKRPRQQPRYDRLRATFLTVFPSSEARPAFWLLPSAGAPTNPSKPSGRGLIDPEGGQMKPAPFPRVREIVVLTITASLGLAAALAVGTGRSRLGPLLS